MRQVLLFRLGDRTFGLEIVQVQEIIESPVLHYIPRSPDTFTGAMNFHGQIIPVLDLPAFLGLAGEERDPRVIVLPSDFCAMALAVGCIRQIIPLDPEVLIPYRETDGANLPVHSLLEREEEIVHLLDLAGLTARLEQIDWRR